MEAGTGECLSRIALKVQYDGTCYNGWQIQDGCRTVQHEIEKAIGILLKQKVRVVASGRTDTGVHALEQIVHFDAKHSVTLSRICIGLNGILPRDVSVINAYNVSNDFHARFSAVEREYKYIIYNNPLRTPFMLNRAMWVQDHIEIDYLKKAAQYLIGEMDFASFCKKKESQNINTVRSVNKIFIEKNDDFIEFRITANAFLHHMIRIIVGTIIDMCKKGINPEELKRILEMHDRDFSGVTAPPYGLYLAKVRYDPPLEKMDSAF